MKFSPRTNSILAANEICQNIYEISATNKINYDPERMKFSPRTNAILAANEICLSLVLPPKSLWIDQGRFELISRLPPRVVPPRVVSQMP